MSALYGGALIGGIGLFVYLNQLKETEVIKLVEQVLTGKDDTEARA